LVDTDGVQVLGLALEHLGHCDHSTHLGFDGGLISIRSTSSLASGTPADQGIQGSTRPSSSRTRSLVTGMGVSPFGVRAGRNRPWKWVPARQGWLLVRVAVRQHAPVVHAHLLVAVLAEHDFAA